MGSGEYWPNDPFKSLEGLRENKNTADKPITTELINYKKNLSTNNDETKNQERPPFFKMPPDLVDSGLLAKMKPTELSVYTVLCHYADYETGNCFPSIDTIRKKTGKNKNSISSAIKKLVEYGLIRKKRSSKKFRYKNTYKVIRDPEINLPSIPKKMDKRRRFLHKENGRFDHPTKKMEIDIHKENMEKDIYPNSMDSNKKELLVNRNNYKTLVEKDHILNEYLKTRGEKWLRKYLLSAGYDKSEINYSLKKLKEKGVHDK
jgi:predicted transcriptional regulator